MDEKELPIPPVAKADEKAREMLRAWIANNGLHCSLNVGIWEKDEAVGWGILLSDVTRHFADALQKTKGKNKAQTIEEVRRVFNDELNSPTAETRGGFVK